MDIKQKKEKIRTFSDKMKGQKFGEDHEGGTPLMMKMLLIKMYADKFTRTGREIELDRALYFINKPLKEFRDDGWITPLEEKEAEDLLLKEIE